MAATQKGCERTVGSTTCDASLEKLSSMTLGSFVRPKKPRDTLISIPRRSMQFSFRKPSGVHRTHNCALAELSCMVTLDVDVSTRSEPAKRGKGEHRNSSGDPAQSRGKVVIAA